MSTYTDATVCSVSFHGLDLPFIGCSSAVFAGEGVACEILSLEAGISGTSKPISVDRLYLEVELEIIYHTVSAYLTTLTSFLTFPL